jgi:hypothetical protein
VFLLAALGLRDAGVGLLSASSLRRVADRSHHGFSFGRGAFVEPLRLDRSKYTNKKQDGPKGMQEN